MHEAKPPLQQCACTAWKGFKMKTPQLTSWIGSLISLLNRLHAKLDAH